MSRRSLSVLVSSTMAFSILTVGCSGGGSPISATSHVMGAARSMSASSYFSASPDVIKNGLIYVADYTDSDIHIYPLKGTDQKEIGLIAGTPVVEYLNVDRWRNLYVVEFSAGTVSVYPQGKTKPSLVLKVEPQGAFPNSVTISQAGEVAVGQFADNGIEFYHKGATEPFNTVIPKAEFGSAGFCAYDGAGNLYVIGSSADHASHLGEIVGGGSGTKVKDLGVTTGITNGKGVQVDTAGHVAVIGDDGTINIYAPHSTKLLSTEVLKDPPSDGPQPNGGFSFMPFGGNLYVASAILNRANQGEALEYAYPKGGDIVNTIDVVVPPNGTQTSVTGVAVSPPEKP